MYDAHSFCVPPKNEHIKIWRYMDFTKFVSLLDSQCLYFTRADKFEDPFEGSWPLANVFARNLIPDDIPEDQVESYVKFMANYGDINKHWPRYIAINCWHMNEHESAAMWKLYLKSDEGIAIQSTYQNFCKCIIDEKKVNIGIVNYIDYETEYMSNAHNACTAFLHKRKSFEHEREIRGIVRKLPDSHSDTGMDFTIDTIYHGINIKVDIECLIEKVYVAPSSPPWFADLVKAVIERYGYDFHVEQSKLNNSPLF